MKNFYAREYERMEQALGVFEPRLTPDLIAKVREAYNAPDWNWRFSNGCNVVDERFWPNRYFPPCVTHDYACVRANKAKTRKEADAIRKQGDKDFFELNKAFGLPMFRLPGRGFMNSVFGRFVGVRFWWFAASRWSVPK
jgi:hypothetical protein